MSGIRRCCGKTETKRGAILMTAVAVCFVLCFAAVFSVCGSDTAYAALPESYLNDAYRNDWHFGADNLNVNALKGVVDGWKADDAFSFEKLLSDPVVIADILRMKREDPVHYAYWYGGEIVSMEGLGADAEMYEQRIDNIGL